jgi:hypothetical protein
LPLPQQHAWLHPFPPNPSRPDPQTTVSGLLWVPETALW